MAATGEGGPTEPRLAATVVLARDCAREAGFEVFLVQRHRGMGFMGGMHVFPGGKLSTSDLSDHAVALVEDANSDHAGPWLKGVDQFRAVGLCIAAIRETFEEAGVLLALGSEHVNRSAMRTRLLDGEDFARLLREAGCRLRLSDLTPMSRWITPTAETRRFDTFFYVARAPADQRAEHDRQETIAGAWMTPEEAMRAADEQRIRLAPPTRRTLNSICHLRAVDAVATHAQTADRQPIQPVIETRGNEVLLLMPGDPDHPDPQRRIAGPTREVLRVLDTK